MVSCEDLQSLSLTIWETLTEEADPPLYEPPAADPDDLRAEVSIAGAWTGYVDVRVSRARAGRLAARLFGRDAVGPDELRDGVLELANILGGNAKALLPGPCDLSLPRARPAGADHDDGVERREVAIGRPSDPLVVRLVRIG